MFWVSNMCAHLLCSNLGRAELVLLTGHLPQELTQSVAPWLTAANEANEAGFHTGNQVRSAREVR